MSSNIVPSGTPVQHHHGTPKPTVVARPRAHKGTPPQVAPIPTVAGMPGGSPYVTGDQLHSGMAVMKNGWGRPWVSGAVFLILPEDGSTMQAILLLIQRRYTQMGLSSATGGPRLLATMWAQDVFTADNGPKRQVDSTAQAFGMVRRNNFVELIVDGVA